MVNALMLGLTLLAVLASDAAAAPRYEAELIFPLHAQHNHAPGIVECPGGGLSKGILSLG